MSTPRQLALPNLKDPRYKRPTMTVETVKGVLDRTEDEVLELVDTYALVAWNIAIGTVRRELRILTRSVSEYLQSNAADSPCYHSTIVPDDAISILAGVTTKPWITGVQVQRALSCSGTHVINLCTDGQLQATAWRRGPGGSPNITRESFIAFLQSRPA